MTGIKRSANGDISGDSRFAKTPRISPSVHESQRDLRIMKSQDDSSTWWGFGSLAIGAISCVTKSCRAVLSTMPNPQPPNMIQPLARNQPLIDTRTLPMPGALTMPPPPPPVSNVSSSGFSESSGVVGSCYPSQATSVLSLSDSSNDAFNAYRRYNSSEIFEKGMRRPYKNRRHIFSHHHKKDVEQRRKEDLEHLSSLFSAQRQAGYTSNLSDFKGYLAYQFKLEQLEKGELTGLPIADISPGEAQLRRRHKTHENEPSLRKVLSNAYKSLKGPKPLKNWAPTLEHLQVRNRSKDDAIEQRLRPKRIPLPTSLPVENEAQVKLLLQKRGLIAKYAREQVNSEDLSRLLPSQWLNDELINFYGAMILGRSDGCKENPPNVKSSSGRGKPLNVHYFSTFFWPKLTKEGYEKARLGKWTKKFDLFGKDVVLIPINHSNTHWTSAAINFRKQRIESYDSMGMPRREVYKALRGYLDKEHREKKKKPFDFTGWEDYQHEDTPQQENGFDCGMFTCQILESLSRGEETFNFTQADMPYLRRRMIWEVGNGQLRDD